MMTRKFLWALLPVAAVLLMTACGGDDADDVKPTPTPNPVTPGTENVVKSVPYSVTVKTADVTRTSVDNDGETLSFEKDDKLYVQNSNGTIYGCLTLKAGEGMTTATFAGTVNYTETPATSTPLTATLVGSGNQLVTTENDKVKSVTYPNNVVVCTSMDEAVKKYSLIRGTGTYGAAVFTLVQETAFMNFNITLEDGTMGGVNVPVEITNITNGSGTYEFNVTTTGEQFSALASFVFPFADGTVIAGDASMCIANVSDEGSIRIGTGSDVTLTGGKVYPVTRTKDFVRLWAGGPVWSTRNLGASSVTDYGNYYAWGETTGYTRKEVYNFGWTNYTHCNKKYVEANNKPYANFKLTKYIKEDDWGTIDHKTTLESVDDAATQSSLGSSWCMPTTGKFTALLVNTNTTNELTTVSGVKGKTFTGNTTNYTGKAIFLPATGLFQGSSLTDPDRGCYWSSSLYTESGRDSRYADVFTFTSSGAETVSYLRCYGRCIRPVRTN